MMKKTLLSVLLLAAGTSMWAQTTIAFWDFNSTVGDANTGTGVITPALGAGTITPINLTLATAFNAGIPADPNLTDNSGYQTTGYPAQGATPKTAGIQIDVNTTGLSNIAISFQQRLSNTAANTWVLQYTLDNSVGSPVWIDAQQFTFTPTTGTGDQWWARTCDLTAVTGLNNNPNVGFRVVSDFDPVAGQYLAARSSSSYAGGTSRFDLVEVESLPTVVPYTLNFVRADYTVSEAAGTAEVWLKVTTAGNTAGSVDLSLSAWSNATASDYTVASTTIPVSDTLILNDTIAFTINLNDDAMAESDEYLICKLTNGVNANYSATAQHTLYIRDNDHVAPTANNQLSLNLLGSFNNGPFATNSAEISAYDSSSKRIFIANSIGSKLDIVNFANPASPSLISSIDITPYGALNSVAVYNGLVALAIEATSPNRQAPGKVVFMDVAGTFISQVDVGVQPDMVVFNHAGTKVYTADEAEPSDDYTNDPDGSITVIDISGGAAGVTAANVTTIGFTSYNGQEATLRSQGIRIYGVAGIASKDFEPEYITIADDDSKAWVTLQENNAILEIDLSNNTITQLMPLGTKNHNTLMNALDASNQTSAVNLSNFPVKGMYLPDAISHYTYGGNLYLLTANEGDTRAWSGLNEEARIGSGGYVLDPVLFPNAAELKNNSVLGRLNASNKMGDIDSDGDFDEIYVFGSRSFSIWNPATASLVYDSGDDFERITSTHPIYGSMFNASNGAGITVKDRSDDKGPEPEGIATGMINGKMYAFVALERIGGVMVYDITDPMNPAYVSYANNRGPDRGSEGIIFISAAESPNGKNLVILSNETSSTLTIYQIDACQAAGIADITANSNTEFCAGGMVELSANQPSLSYQWLMNGSPIAGSNFTSYYANATGNYALHAYNASGCEDTSAAITVTTAPIPNINVTTVGVSPFCAGDSMVFSAMATGGYTYQWLESNTPVGSATASNYTATASGSYAVIVTNNGICSDTSSATSVTVNANPTTPTVSITGNGDVLDCPAIGVTFQWYEGGNPISGATSSTYTATVNGIYSVEVTNASGCTAMSNTVAISAVGLAKNTASIHSAVYPNPGTGTLNIELNTASADVFTVELYNLVGQKVDVIASKLAVSRKEVIAYEFPASLSEGIYFVKIRNTAGETTKRIVLQH